MAGVREAGGRHRIQAVACLALVAGVAGVAGCPGPTSAAPFPDEGAAAVIERYRALIPELMAEQGLPGLAIAVVDGDRVLWSQGFGTTDRDGGTPVTTDTMFSVQSMSKTFTATAVMQAVQAGRVDLDEPITTYLPGFTVHSAFEDHPERRITLRMLLAHTAGFTHEAPYGNNFDLGENDFARHVESISETWLRFPVGTGYAYSNLDIDLAGHILERAWDEPFPAAMEDSLLGPLGMEHSTFDQARIRSASDRALGHTSIIGNPPVDVPMGPSGGLYASVDDVAQFLRFQLGGGAIAGRSVLDPALMEEMRTIPAPNAGEESGYALGVARTHWRAGRYLDLFSHGGGGFGFLADLWWLPQLQLGITVLTNGTDHELQGDLALSVLEDLVREPGSVYRERLAAQPFQRDVDDTGSFHPPEDLGSLIAAAAMAPAGDEAERWAAYVGDYRTVTWGVMDPFSPPGRFLLVNGVPTIELSEGGNRIRHRLVEVEAGLFLADNGEMLDLRGPRATWCSVDLFRVTGGPSPVSWAALALSGAAAAWWLVGGAVGAVLRRRRGGATPAEGRAARRWGRVAAGVATLASLLALATIALVALLPTVVDTGFLGWLELPLPVRLAMHAPLALAVAAALLVGLCAAAWARGWWMPIRRPRVTGLALMATVLTVQVWAWRLLGWGLT